MSNGICQYYINIGGCIINKTINRSADHPNPYEVTLPVGKAGTLGTRTDDNTGIVTSNAHGYNNADVVDVYWNGGVHYGMTVSNVATNALDIDAGAGDNLPEANVAVVVTKQVQINTVIDGDTSKMIAICAEYANSLSVTAAHLDFQDSGNVTVKEIDLVANQPYTWDGNSGQANPLTGNAIARCMASSGDTAENCTMKIATLDDATP